MRKAAMNLSANHFTSQPSLTSMTLSLILAIWQPLPSTELDHINTSFHSWCQFRSLTAAHSLQEVRPYVIHSVKWCWWHWLTSHSSPHSTLQRSQDISAGPGSKHFSQLKVLFEGKAKYLTVGWTQTFTLKHGDPSSIPTLTPHPWR
jgi:hypothetical protein